MDPREKVERTQSISDIKITKKESPKINLRRFVDSRIAKNRVSTAWKGTTKARKLPALDTDKNVSEIVDKAEKEIEKKEKDFIIQIISSSVPLQPIPKEKQANGEKIFSRLKSREIIIEDILNIRSAKPNGEGISGNVKKGLKPMSASLPLRKKVISSPQRSISSPKMNTKAETSLLYFKEDNVVMLNPDHKKLDLGYILHDESSGSDQFTSESSNVYQKASDDMNISIIENFEASTSSTFETSKGSLTLASPASCDQISSAHSQDEKWHQLRNVVQQKRLKNGSSTEILPQKPLSSKVMDNIQQTVITVDEANKPKVSAAAEVQPEPTELDTEAIPSSTMVDANGKSYFTAVDVKTSSTSEAKVQCLSTTKSSKIFLVDPYKEPFQITLEGSKETIQPGDFKTKGSLDEPLQEHNETLAVNITNITPEGSEGTIQLGNIDTKSHLDESLQAQHETSPLNTTSSPKKTIIHQLSSSTKSFHEQNLKKQSSGRNPQGCQPNEKLQNGHTNENCESSVNISHLVCKEPSSDLKLERNLQESDNTNRKPNMDLSTSTSTATSTSKSVLEEVFIENSESFTKTTKESVPKSVIPLSKTSNEESEVKITVTKGEETKEKTIVGENDTERGESEENSLVGENVPSVLAPDAKEGETKDNYIGGENVPSGSALDTERGETKDNSIVCENVPLVSAPDAKEGETKDNSIVGKNVPSGSALDTERGETKDNSIEGENVPLASTPDAKEGETIEHSIVGKNVPSGSALDMERGETKDNSIGGENVPLASTPDAKEGETIEHSIVGKNVPSGSALDTERGETNQNSIVGENVPLVSGPDMNKGETMNHGLSDGDSVDFVIRKENVDLTSSVGNVTEDDTLVCEGDKTNVAIRSINDQFTSEDIFSGDSKSVKSSGIDQQSITDSEYVNESSDPLNTTTGNLELENDPENSNKSFEDDFTNDEDEENLTSNSTSSSTNQSSEDSSTELTQLNQDYEVKIEIVKEMHGMQSVIPHNKDGTTSIFRLQSKKDEGKSNKSSQGARNEGRKKQATKPMAIKNSRTSGMSRKMSYDEDDQNDKISNVDELSHKRAIHSDVDKNMTSVDAIYLNIPLNLEEPQTKFESPTVTYSVQNETYEGKIETEINSESDTEKWNVVPFGEDSLNKWQDDVSITSATSSLSWNEERALSMRLKRFIEVEGIDSSLLKRYETYLESRQQRKSQNSKNKHDEETLHIIIDEINSLIATKKRAENNEEAQNHYLPFHSVYEGSENSSGKGQKSRNQSRLQLRREATNRKIGHVEKSPSSQSGLKETCSTIKSIDNSDLKGTLTTSRNSKPQVTAEKSHLASQTLQKRSALSGARKKVFALQKSSVRPKDHEIKHISFKEENLVYSSPESRHLPLKHPSATTQSRWNDANQRVFEGDRERSQNKNGTKHRKILGSKISARGRRDMLARSGPTTVASQSEIPKTKYLPPLRGNQSSKLWQRVKHTSDNAMVFDFLNPFKRYRGRGKRGRVPISVKPNPVKTQKGYEYEDLVAKRKQFEEKRRNSLGKIYIQDPNNRNHILVAEEIGYVYGDPRQHVQQLKPTKENRGIQTVPLKQPKAKSGADRNKKRTGFITSKFKQRKLPKPFTTIYDLQAASKLETPREKGDYVIYPSKKLKKLVSKTVTFKEAERGIPSISSTILQDPHDRLYGNKRDVATDSQNFFQPQDPYSSHKMLTPRISAGSYANRLPPSYPMRNPVLERRASFDGPLPPVRARAGDRINGEYYNQIHQSSSHPNLTHSSSSSFLLPPEGNAESPLRTFESPGVHGPSGSKKGLGKRGWAKVKQLTTRSGKKDTVIGGFGSNSDLSSFGGSARVPGTNVPIVLLQGFFKNARGDKGPQRPNRNEGNKIALPKNLLEPNSLLRGALPILPTYLATFCLTLNVFVPGFGTLLSGWLGACAGRSRLDKVEKEGQRFLSIMVTGLTGIIQMFTVSFFFVGWFWSVGWGILLVSVARKYKQFLYDNRAQNRNYRFDMLAVNTN